MRKRMVLLGLVVSALMLLSMSLSMARTFPTNPIFLAPGLRETGAYTMIVPGTYGKLLPIIPFPWAKDVPPQPIPNGNKDGSVASPMGSNNASPSGPIQRVGNAPPGGKIMNGPGSAENMGMPMGNFLGGAGLASNHVDNLENDLRDAIRKLNAK